MNIIKEIAKCIKKPEKIRLWIYRRFMIKTVDDAKYLSAFYAAAFGEKMDFNNPITYNQKLQWLKLYYRNPNYTLLVDKNAVKKYVKNVIGDEYIIQTYGVYNSFSEIDFSSLPSRFVLKCTHDSGSTVLCLDKTKLDFEEVQLKLDSRLKQNPFWDNGEWPYKNVVPRIICEELLQDDSQDDLMDYKFMCFNGEPKCVFVCSNRRGAELYVDFYDLNWNHLPFERHYHNNPKPITPPKNLKKMIKLAQRLSAGMPHVRVDFYEINARVYFGELTFFPGSGVEEFSPASYDKMIGSWLDLPEKLT